MSSIQKIRTAISDYGKLAAEYISNLREDGLKEGANQLIDDFVENPARALCGISFSKEPFYGLSRKGLLERKMMRSIEGELLFEGVNPETASQIAFDYVKTDRLKPEDIEHIKGAVEYIRECGMPRRSDKRGSPNLMYRDDDQKASFARETAADERVNEFLTNLVASSYSGMQSMPGMETSRFSTPSSRETADVELLNSSLFNALSDKRQKRVAFQPSDHKTFGAINPNPESRNLYGSGNWEALDLFYSMERG